MKIQIDTTELDKLQDKVSSVYSCEPGKRTNLYYWDRRFGNDTAIAFDEFLIGLGLCKTYGSPLVKGGKKKLGIIQDYANEEFTAGFISGFELLRRWIEKTATQDYKALAEINKSFGKLEQKPTLEDLKNQRNKLNRQISTLKKANLKQ